MRKLVLVPLLLASAACGNSGTGTDGVINIRVVDDAGRGIPRARVTVAMAASAIAVVETNADGVAEARVAGEGSYDVSIVPRVGYLRGQDPTSRRVQLAASSRTSVEFKLQRAGLTSGDPDGTPYTP